MDRREKKVEASIPVQARVNIMSLANLDTYWSSEGYNIRTMSQLVGHSIELLSEILRANGKLNQEILTVADANNYLNRRGLHQAGMRDKAMKKIGKAIMFENMRAEGADPKLYTPRAYSILHRQPDEQGKPSTVVPYTGRVDSEQVKQAAEIASSISEEELMKRIMERDHNEVNEEVPTIIANENVVKETRVESELPLLSEKKNSKATIEAHIREADERSMAQMEELKNVDLKSLMSKAIKE